jgi:hypothetical protein
MKKTGTGSHMPVFFRTEKEIQKIEHNPNIISLRGGWKSGF